MTTATTAPATDVNEQFFRERRDLMTNARAVRNADGKYVATAGWDANEVIGKDGLDMSTGQAALATTTMAWHGLGEIIPAGTTDIDLVMKAGRIDYGVDSVPAFYPWNGGYREAPGRRHLIRTDTGAFLGEVGEGFTVFQPRESFEFLQSLTANHQLEWESAGALRGGKNVFVTARLPENIVVDPGGVADEVVPFIDVIDTYGGASFKVMVTPWRIVCANTARAAQEDAVSMWKVRHTRNAHANLETARKTLGLSVKYFEEFAEQQTTLAQTDMAIAEFHDVLRDLFPCAEDEKPKVKKLNEERIDLIDRIYNESPTLDNCRGTAYAGYHAIGEFWDWYSGVKVPKTMSELNARSHRFFDGTHDELKKRAHERLLLVNTHK